MYLFISIFHLLAETFVYFNIYQYLYNVKKNVSFSLAFYNFFCIGYYLQSQNILIKKFYPWLLFFGLNSLVFVIKNSLICFWNILFASTRCVVCDKQELQCSAFLCTTIGRKDLLILDSYHSTDMWPSHCLWIKNDI